MPTYNVHIYRELRLLFRDVEAATPEAAANIARDGQTEDADEIEDCDGVDLAALVDVVGDDDFAHSVTIDFAAARLRKSAPALLSALQAVLAVCCGMIDDLENLDGSGIHRTVKAARDAVDQAAGKEAV